MKERLTLLDGWRGTAVILVLLGHFLPLPLFNAGRFGVELFFVLSGRLMAELLFIRRESLPRFYWRRFTRIAPALYGYILTVTAVSLLGGLDFGVNQKSLLAAVTFSYNYLHVLPGYATTTFDHLWSLCVEEHSYIVLGLAALALARSRAGAWRVCIGLAVVCMLCGVYLTLWTNGDYYDVYWRTDSRASAILLGCGFYCLALEKPQAFEWIRGTTLLLMFAMVLALSLGRVSDCFKYTLGTTTLALCMARIESLPLFFKQVLASPPLVYAGMASFSLYLYQQPFFHAELRQHSRLLMLAAAVAAGLASYHLIERPARRTLNEWFLRPTRLT